MISNEKKYLHCRKSKLGNLKGIMQIAAQNWEKQKQEKQDDNKLYRKIYKLRRKDVFIIKTHNHLI